MSTSSKISEDMVIVGLKVGIIKQRTKWEVAVAQNAVLIDALFESWQSFKPNESSVWKIVESLGLAVRINSKLIGVKTDIDEYTNKSGKKHMAHYTHNGMYLRPVDMEKAGDDKPMYYVGTFWIKVENFKFVYNPKKAKCIEDYFVPFRPRIVTPPQPLLPIGTCIIVDDD